MSLSCENPQQTTRTTSAARSRAAGAAEAAPAGHSRDETWPRWLGRRWNYAHYHVRAWARGVRVQPIPGWGAWRRASRADLRADARAGANVALLAFPQSIAYSLIAGVPAQFGLIGSALSAIVGPLFSGSRFIVAGPTNATAILLFSGLTAAGVAADDRVAALPLFVLLVGVFQLLGAVVRASSFLNYISRAVVSGYVTAAALLIIAHQIQNALGFQVSGASTFFAVLSGTLREIVATRWPELLLSLGTLAVHLAGARFLPRLPGVACTLVTMSVVALGFEWLGWKLAYLSGFSLTHMPVFNFAFSFELAGRLAPPALALAFVAILEGSSIGRTLAAQRGEPLDTNQELYGLGVANVANAFGGGMAASGSLTRSALSVGSGARTVCATLFGGLLVLALLFSVGFLIDRIPRAALAVVVICIGTSLIDARQIRVALRTTRSDATVFLVSLVAGLFFTLDAAIYLGAFISVVLYLQKAGTPELTEYAFNSAGQLAELPHPGARPQPGISILHAEGELFFGATELFMQQTREIIKDPSLRVVILRLKNARNLDATCALAIEELLGFLRGSGRHLIVSGADREVLRVFRNSGLLAKVGPENFFREVPGNPTVSTRHALLRARSLLGETSAHVRIFVPSDSRQPAA